MTFQPQYAGAPPTGTAGGDLGGTYPNPTVVGSTHLASPVAIAQGGTGQTARTAPAVFQPANPSSTVSTTLVMMGLGAMVAFTPTGSGKVMIVMTGSAFTNTGAVFGTFGGRYGTGTAPANGVAVTGTRFGAAADPNFRAPQIGSTTPAGISLTDVLSLTPSTAYWFDIALDTSNASDAASIANLSFTIIELF